MKNASQKLMTAWKLLSKFENGRGFFSYIPVVLLHGINCTEMIIYDIIII